MWSQNPGYLEKTIRWHLLAEECLVYILNYRRYGKELSHFPFPMPAQETNSETLTHYAPNITFGNMSII